MTLRGGAVCFFMLALCAGTKAQAPVPAPAQTDWPCKQVRVPEIALGGVWSGPALDDARRDWRADSGVADLVARLTPRRTPMEEAEALITDFAKAAGDKRKARLATLFAGIYERMNDERREIVSGLDRFGRRLKEMAQQSRDESQALHEAQGKTPADSDAIKKASETLQWRLRIFEEQRRMVAFVCERPALIEQRLGALARATQAAMD